MVWRNGPHQPVEFWISSSPSRTRVTVIVLGALAATGSYTLTWAAIAGLFEFSGEWHDALVVNNRFGDWVFEQAWHYFVPVFSMLFLCVIGMFGSLIHIVMNPRDGRSGPTTRDT